MQFGVVKRGTQSKAVGDAGELSAVANAVGSEPLIELVSQVANHRGAASEEDGFDTRVIKFCVAHE